MSTIITPEVMCLTKERRVRYPELLLVIVCLSVMVGVSTQVGYRRPLKDAFEHVRYWHRLEKFTGLLVQYNLTDYLRRDGITVFAPVSNAFTQFQEDAMRFGYSLADHRTMRDILLSHIGEGMVSMTDMSSRTAIRSFHPHYKHLYFNSYTYEDSTIFSVNGAWVIGDEIMSSNGYVHIIDRFIIPMQSDKPIAQFLHEPDFPHLSFGSIKNASVIDMTLTNATNSSSYSFTVFSPNDSYITNMPKYGQDQLFFNLSLLKTVFWAHVVEGEKMFIPRLGDLPSLAAKAGVVKFDRVNSEVYVSNNKVRAKIIQPNVPVANGVIHVVDDLLFFVYRNFRQKIGVLPNAKFINTSIAKVDESLQRTFDASERKMTFFLPTDDAFAKLPTDKQMRLDQSIAGLAKMLRDHLLNYAERDIDSFVDGERFTTRDGEVLMIHREGKEVYVEGGGIKAQVTVADIGCTNGVIHLINSVLFQRDFTIWDAIKGNPQLSSMAVFLNNNLDLQLTLASASNGPMTVFLISDAEYKRLPHDTIQYLEINSSALEQAIKGSITDGIITSSRVANEMVLPTHSDFTVTLYSSNQGLYIVGSRIRANVVISDIWCSNGILHIIDNILHIPTRNIFDEIQNQPSLSTMMGLLNQFSHFQVLRNSSYTFTVFMPSDEAFTYMPTYRAQKLLQHQYELQNIIKAHIIPGVCRFDEEFADYNKFHSQLGTPIFILKSEGEATSVISNNVKGRITESNIRCTNGMIHIVDTLLHFPYWTVAETIEKVDELKPFYHIIENVDGFDAWSSTPDVHQTLFIPRENFILGLSNFHSTYIMSEPGMRRKMYQSHYLQDVTLSQLFLDNEFRQTMVYVTESRYNISFIVRDVSDTNELMTVDIGYSNLRWTFDAVRDGIGCSNGVIYIIDGFLNYPLYNIQRELKRQPKITLGADLLVKLVPKNTSLDLESTDTKFTVFTPSDESLKNLTFQEIEYINGNLSYAERIELTSRHIVIGQQFSEEDILSGKFHAHALRYNMSILSTTNGLYIQWKDVTARIIRSNILATNGIIHVVDRLLLSTPYWTTTVPSTTTKTTRTDNVSSGANTVFYKTFIMCNSLTVHAIVCSLCVIQFIITSVNR